MQAWNRRDADRLADLFEENAEFVNVTGLWWHNREAIRRVHNYGLRTIFDQSTIALVTRRVTWLVGGPAPDPAAAVVHAKMELEDQSAVADVDDPRPRRTIFTFVVRRADDGWRCTAARNTDVVPGAETNVIDDQGQMRSVNYRSLLPPQHPTLNTQPSTPNPLPPHPITRRFAYFSFSFLLPTSAPKKTTAVVFSPSPSTLCTFPCPNFWCSTRAPGTISPWPSS